MSLVLPFPAWRRWLLSALFIYGAFATSPYAQEAPLLLVAAGIDSNQLTSDLPCQKAYQLIAQEALRRARIDFVCEAVAWKRGQKMVQDGERDAMVTLLTTERADYSIASNEIVYQAQLRAFVNAHDERRNQLAALNSIEQLKSWRVLSYLGDGWSKTHLEAAGVHVDWSRDMATVLNKLLAQRGDICISDTALVMPLIHAMNLQNDIVMLPTIFDTSNLRFLISRKSNYAGKMPAIDAALKAMREDGSSRRIIHLSLSQSR